MEGPIFFVNGCAYFILSTEPTGQRMCLFYLVDRANGSTDVLMLSCRQSQRVNGFAHVILLTKSTHQRRTTLLTYVDILSSSSSSIYDNMYHDTTSRNYQLLLPGNRVTPQRSFRNSNAKRQEKANQCRFASAPTRIGVDQVDMSAASVHSPCDMSVIYTKDASD